MASVVGFRMARPVRSATIRLAASGQLPARASAGTCQHIHHVTGDSNQPLLPSLGAKVTAKLRQCISEQFSEPGGESDNRSARPESLEIGQ